MPKKIYKQIKLPVKQPDCCTECPLLGVIPKEELPKKCRETRVCLMTHDAMTPSLSRSQKSTKDKHHPLKRYCDHEWDLYHHPPLNGNFNLRIVDWIRYRMPYEERKVLSIKFHK